MKRAAIIISSDSGYRGEREDLSGPVIGEILKANGYQVVHSIILPDEPEKLSREMVRIADDEVAELLITTGGTGFSPRDRMPEATLEVLERVVPGIPEAMRFNSLQFTKRAMLSRGTAGIRKNTLIINLPGSPKAVRECLLYIMSEVEHGLEILLSEAFNCASGERG